jgi:CRP/FNR family transcriptional regulator
MNAELERHELPFFRSLGDAQRARLERHLVRKRLSPRQVLFLEGEPASHAWLCVRGRVRLYKGSPDGRTTTLETLGPGEIFGAISALHDADYPVSAEATTEALVCGLAKDVVLRLLEEDPRLAVEILDVVSRRLRAAHERVRSFASDAAPARLAQALLRAAPTGHARGTRRELADAAGTSVETAIRVLRGFERAGLVRGEVGHLQVLDRAALERVAAGEPPPSRRSPGEGSRRT